MIETNRRSVIVGLTSLLVSPAIVRADSLMRVTGERYFFWECSYPLLPDIRFPFESDAARDAEFSKCFGPNGRLYKGTWTYFTNRKTIYQDHIAFRKEEYPE